MAKRSSPLLEVEAVENGAPLLEGDPASLREELRRLPVRELRKRAKAWSVNLRGKKRKDDILDLLVQGLVDRREEVLVFAKEGEVEVHELPFGRLEDLWIEAAHRLDEGDFRSSLAFVREAFLVLATWTDDYRRGMCATGLEAARRFVSRYGGGSDLGDHLREAAEAYAAGDLEGCARLLDRLQEDLTELHVAQVGRIHDTLQDKQALLERMGGLDLDLTEARELLVAAEEASGRDEHHRALELLRRLDEVVHEAKRVRMAELKERMAVVEDRLIQAEGLGASVEEVGRLLDQARDAYRREDLVLCRELIPRCERAVLEAQKQQIEKALRVRRTYVDQVRELMNYLKPVLREADAYGLDAQRARQQLREAVDLLRQEDYFAALERGEDAKASLLALLPRIVEARMRRGVAPPEDAACRQCNTTELVFQDDGWGTCRSCGFRFVWSTRDLPRILTFLREKLVPQR